MSNDPFPAAARRPDPGLHARTFTAWPAWADVSLDVVQYGPDIPTEAEFRLLGNVEGKRILELGCGGGPTSVALAKQGAKVIAVEDDGEQVGHARRLCEREEVKVEVHHGDVADLAFVRADSIDVAVSIYALGAVEDLSRVFRQVHRVLRPEAPIVLSLPHPMFSAVHPSAMPPTFRRSYFDTSALSWQSDATFGTDVPHSVGKVFTALSRANFRVDTILEPEPTSGAHRSRHWSEAMRWVPATLIVRARKQGI